MKGWSPGLGFKKRPKVIRINNNKTVRRGLDGFSRFFRLFLFRSCCYCFISVLFWGFFPYILSHFAYFYGKHSIKKNNQRKR